VKLTARDLDAVFEVHNFLEDRPNAHSRIKYFDMCVHLFRESSGSPELYEGLVQSEAIPWICALLSANVCLKKVHIRIVLSRDLREDLTDSGERITSESFESSKSGASRSLFTFPVIKRMRSR